MITQWTLTYFDENDDHEAAKAQQKQQSQSISSHF